MSRLHSDRGFTLVEVLIVSVLFLVVLTATVTAMATFERGSRDQQRVDDQTERVRRAVDRGMRQLRNLANRPATGQATIARATPTDFVFQTSDPQRTWVRICSQTMANGTSRLFTMENATAATAPASTACPGTTADWPTRNPVATNLTNTAVASRNIPLFTYGRNCVASTSATCATDLGSITSVTMDVLLDDNLAKHPAETRVSSGVFLRNQNEKPNASYTWRGIGPRQVVLNGSASTDPEGRTLKYYWYRNARPAGWSCQDPNGTSDVTYWQGMTVNFTFLPGDAASGSTATFELMVCDPGDLWDDFIPASANRVIIP